DSAEPGARDSLRAAVGRTRRSVRADPRGPLPDRVGAQEPRTGYPRRVRTTDRRGWREEISRPADGAAAAVLIFLGRSAAHLCHVLLLHPFDLELAGRCDHLVHHFVEV